MVSPFQEAAATTAGSTGSSQRGPTGLGGGTSRAEPTASQLEQGHCQGSATLQSAGSIPNPDGEDEDDVFLTPGHALKPLKK